MEIIKVEINMNACSEQISSKALIHRNHHQFILLIIMKRCGKQQRQHENVQATSAASIEDNGLHHCKQCKCQWARARRSVRATERTPDEEPPAPRSPAASSPPPRKKLVSISPRSKPPLRACGLSRFKFASSCKGDRERNQRIRRKADL